MNILTQFLVILLLSIICHVLTKLYAGDLLYKFCEWEKFQQLLVWYFKKYKKLDVTLGFNGYGFSIWNKNYNSTLLKDNENWYTKTIIPNKYFE